MSRVITLFAALVLLMSASSTRAANDSVPEVGPVFSGAWYDPSHNGEGFLLEIFDDGRAVVYWFTYDANGRQRWMVGSSRVIGTRIVFDQLLVFKGPVFGNDYDPNDLVSINVGSATIEFSACGKGTVSYVVDGVAGDQDLVSLSSIAGHDCSAPRRSSNALLSGLSGSWYLPARNGEGIVFQTIAPGRAFAYWFTYNQAGEQAWFFGFGSIKDGKLVLDQVYAPTGPKFGPDYDPDDLVLNEWGSLDFNLSCSGFSYSYESEGFGSGQREVQNLSRIGQTRCLDATGTPVSLEAALQAQVNPTNFEFGASWGFRSGITGASWHGAAGTSGNRVAKMTRGHAFRAGGLGELYTAALVLLLDEQGQLDIELPMSQYLNPALIDGLGMFRGEDHTSQITLRHLLGHQSGLPDLLQPPEGGNSFLDLLLQSPEGAWSNKEIIDFARLSLRAESPPGTDVLHSDLNYVLLAAIVETVSGRTLADVFRDHVSAPLGMNATWHLFREVAPEGVKLAAAHLEETDITEIPSLGSFNSGSGWATTAGDLGRFLQALNAGNIGDSDLAGQMFKTHGSFLGAADLGFGAMVRTGDCILPSSSLKGYFGGGAFALIIPERQSLVYGFNSRLDQFGLGYAADLLEAAFGPGTCRDAGSWARHDSPEEGGFSTDGLAQVDDFLAGTDASALIAISEGKVVYQYGLTGRRYASHSIRKAFLSALFGNEAASGLINMDSTMGELGISDLTPLTETEQTATVRDLMQARSGIYLPAAGSSDNDPLPPRGSAVPGERWFYNNWDFNAMATIYENATGDSLYDRYITDIASPLGMDDIRRQDQIYLYERLLSDHPMYMFSVTARDMARFGQLFLNVGAWNGNQVIPSNWVQRSVTSYSETGNASRPGFGYMNWSILADGFMTTGSGGHKILVIPQADMVIVIRVDTYNDGHHVSDEIFETAVQLILAARQ